MIQDLGKRIEAKIEKMQEMFNKNLEELKNKQTEMNLSMKKKQTHRPREQTSGGQGGWGWEKDGVEG